MLFELNIFEFIASGCVFVYLFIFFFLIHRTHSKVQYQSISIDLDLFDFVQRPTKFRVNKKLLKLMVLFHGGAYNTEAQMTAINS